MNLIAFLEQVAGLIGAVMVLSAYFMMQAGFLENTAYLFLILNLAGGAMLFLASWVTGQWGLIFLEGTWTIVSAYALIKRICQKRGTNHGH